MARMLRTLALLALASVTLPAWSQTYDIDIHGSNTIGAALGPMLMTGFLEQYTGGNVTSQSGSQENEQVLSAQNNGTPINIRVAAHGSSTGFRALADGTADIWASSRPAKATEIEAMAGTADLTNLDSEHVIAIDGLAILVHNSNPLNSISIDDLGKVFSGQISNWSQLGGANEAIRLYARDDKSGTWDTFKSLVLGRSYTLAPTAFRYESNDQLSDDVSRDPAAIGFAGLASVRNAKLLAVSDGDAPALKPNQLTVASEDYPLARRLFLYTRGTNNPALANEFLEFVQSPAGQDIVAESGFISQNPIAMDPEYDASVPESFKTLTQQYRRLTVNFRFAEGRSRLDNKAQRDLQRVVDYLNRENQNPNDVLLIGFADQQVDELRAQMISELRALAVSRALRQAGSDVRSYTGYGHYMPVGSAGGHTGEQRNGRVEVWIRNH
ncbi:substrate-binding domain-containing protein [Marinobacter zhejiangensis]|uniref:Phosphate transport system substrate-binding protein n=1 Tax=Marinobacter zhejiangensis TaxID=488535 RepID=A0A1I4L170_9GAMM|nr:phosphate ABC transporter substrate-binding/OmpA family protein [Marinobacter zhejiangensis]SFL84596.1 phosphate transport system substrate-binding protein [Marinobacter zhejiangensis]